MKKVFFTLILILTACLSHAQVLYGTTVGGGSADRGAICKLDVATNTLTAAFSFTGTISQGSSFGSLVQASNGKLYGMTNQIGSNGYGDIFSYDPVTATYTDLHDFDYTTGGYPYGNLVQASDGKLYGMTSEGGSSSAGVIFSYDPATANYVKLQDFNGGTNGGTPAGSLIQASDGKLYGMTAVGGSSDAGVIFSYDPATTTYAKLQDFNNTRGINPFGSLAEASDGKLYGMTTAGGSGDAGVIFSYDPATATYTKLKDFDLINAGIPFGSLVQASNGKLYGMTYGGGSSISIGNGAIFSYDPANFTYVKLHNFNYANGVNPQGSLLQASDGKLYGMTSTGGSGEAGVSFSFDPVTNTYTKLADFTGTNGSGPGYTSFIEVACTPTTWYGDADGDGFGDVNNSTTTCSSTPPAGYAANSSDCDDTKPLYSDNDGDGFGAVPNVACGIADYTDCNDNDASIHSPVTYYKDDDNDGFGNLYNTTSVCSLTPPAGYVANSSDCDDTKLLYADNDGDGFGAGSPVACGVEDNTDCNDNDATVHRPVTYYKDNDNDGFGDLNHTTTACSSALPPGYVANHADCNDNDATMHRLVTYYKDNDNDGFGDLNHTTTACSSTPPPGYVANHADCNDNDATVHRPVTYYKDNDNDGFGDLNHTTTACSLTPPPGYVANHADCNDNDATMHRPVTYYKDNDNDGFGDPNHTITACSLTPPPGYVASNRDCNDNSATVHPGAPEICGNSIDDNCNGQTDEGCSPVLITIYGRSVPEGNKTIPRNFAVNLSKSSANTITVDYTTQDITAAAGSDYIAQTGTLTFEPGIRKNVITIQVIGDKVPQPDKTFKILLSNPVNADIAGGTDIVTILNDDGPAPLKPGAQQQDAGSAVLKDVTLSPNPANGKVNIVLTGYSGNLTIQLMDINGKLLQEKKVTSLFKVSQQPIDISNYADGVYLVTVIDEKGNRKTQKLVISR